MTVPDLGAKLVSLLDKRTGQEWLGPPAQLPAGVVPYGASAVEYHTLSGWDEMFPTIDVCEYPGPGDNHGKLMPDHGDAWTLPWETQKSQAGELSLTVRGQALPYSLTRSMSFLDAATLQMRYRVTQQGHQPLAYLWAAHPLFVCDTETEIVLPPDVTELYNVKTTDTWGAAGCRYRWPQTMSADGRSWQLNRIAPPTQRDCRKFYVPPEIRIDWAALVQRSSGSRLRLSWSAKQAPYLGIWVDEGFYTVESTVALEPATAFYDNLALAWEKGRVSVLPPLACHEWELILQVGYQSFRTEN
jgi:galactose mutarotase-like enzyme